MNIHYVYIIGGTVDLRSTSGDNGAISFTYTSSEDVIDSFNNVAIEEDITLNNCKIADVTTFNYEYNIVADTLHPYIINMDISESERTFTLEGMLYYAFKADTIAVITIEFSEDIILSNVSLFVTGKDLDIHTDKSFEFTCAGLVEFARTTTCTYTVSNGNDSYDLRVTDIVINSGGYIGDQTKNITSVNTYNSLSPFVYDNNEKTSTDTNNTQTDNYSADACINIDFMDSSCVESEGTYSRSAQRMILFDTISPTPESITPEGGDLNTWYDLSGNSKHGVISGSFEDEAYINDYFIKSVSGTANVWIGNGLIQRGSTNKVTISDLTSKVTNSKYYTIELAIININAELKLGSTQLSVSNYCSSGSFCQVSLVYTGTGSLPSEFETIEIIGEATIYALRYYYIALSSSEIASNKAKDKSRYESITNLEDTSGYVTKGLEVWLDGYYHSNKRQVSGQQVNVTLQKVEREESLGGFISGINYEASYYYWAKNGETVTYDSLLWGTNALSNLFTGTFPENETVSIQLPTEDGAWSLWLLLIDNAGNGEVYRYIKEYVIDTTRPTINGVEVVSMTNYYDTDNYYYNSDVNENYDRDYTTRDDLEGDTIIILVIFSEGVQNSDTVVTNLGFSISGGKKGTLTRRVSGSYVEYAYVVYKNPNTSLTSDDGDNGDLVFSYTPTGIKDLLNNSISDSSVKTINGTTKQITVGETTSYYKGAVVRFLHLLQQDNINLMIIWSITILQEKQLT